MRIVSWGTYDTGKPRIRILLDGLRESGVDVEAIHAPAWAGIEDKSQLRGWRAGLRIAAHCVRAYPSLLWRLIRTPRPDLLLLSYPGVLDILVAFPIARIRRMPIAWDVFISLYDTVCEDRRILRRNSFAARSLFFLERMAFRCADLPFMDTQAHATRMERLFRRPARSCGAVWVGAETDRFPHLGEPDGAGLRDRNMRVLFYGQFIPLHGIAIIVAAARLLRDAPIEWQLVGRGQEADRIRKLLSEDPLPSLQWIDWIEYAELVATIAKADLCMGVFGTSEKAASVIPNKVFQIVACGRPLITADTPAIREMLSPSTPCVRLIPAGDAHALAEAVVAHLHAMQEGVGETGCHKELRDQIGPFAIGQQFLAMLDRRMSGF